MLGAHKQNLVCTRAQGKEKWPSQETEPVLPLNVWQSPAEDWVNRGPAAGSRILTESILGGIAGWHKSFWRRLSLPLP